MIAAIAMDIVLKAILITTVLAILLVTNTIQPDLLLVPSPELLLDYFSSFSYLLSPAIAIKKDKHKILPSNRPWWIQPIKQNKIIPPSSFLNNHLLKTYIPNHCMDNQPIHNLPTDNQLTLNRCTGNNLISNNNKCMDKIPVMNNHTKDQLNPWSSINDSSKHYSIF